MPALTTFRILKPNVHRLTIDASMQFPVLFFYEMRGAGGGSGGGTLYSGAYKRGGDGWHGTKTVGQLILNPGDTVFLCPGQAGKKAASNVSSYSGAGLGGRGVVATLDGRTYRFAGGTGGNASSSGTNKTFGAGGGGGGASVIIVHRASGGNYPEQLVAVAAGGGGGGGAGDSNSITSDRPYIGSVTNSTNGGGKGQTHGDSYYTNYRYGSFLGYYGAGAGGGGGGAKNGDGGLIDFYDKPSFPGSAGTSFSSKIVNSNTIEIITSNIETAPPGGLENQLGGAGGGAAQVLDGVATDGDDGYIVGYMYPLNTVRYKEGSEWILPDSFYYKVDSTKWSTVRKMFLKHGTSKWRKFYDIDVYYELVSSDESAYSYGDSTHPAIRKEDEPPPPPPPSPPAYYDIGGAAGTTYITPTTSSTAAPNKNLVTAAVTAVYTPPPPAPTPVPAPAPATVFLPDTASAGDPGGPSAPSAPSTTGGCDTSVSTCAPSGNTDGAAEGGNTAANAAAESASASSGDSSGDCYLTTAATQYANLPDNCDELESARALREIARKSNKRNELLISLYYKIAPLIVQRKSDWSDFFESTMKPMVTLFEQGKHSEAIKIYRKETAKLIREHITVNDREIIEFTFDGIFKLPKTPYFVKCAVLKIMLYLELNRK